MGLLAEVQTMNIREARKEQEQQKQLKEIKKIEEKKEREKEQKQYEKDLTKAVENDLKKCFMRCFENEGLKNGYINLRLLSTRIEIIQNISENALERHFIDENYEKILLKVKRIYENDQKAKDEYTQIKLLEEQQKQQEEEKKQQEEQQKKNIFINILYYLVQGIKWLFIILFGGIYLIFKFIYELANKLY